MDRLHPKQQEKRKAYQEQLFTDWVADRRSESFECFLIALTSIGNQRCGCCRSFSTTGTHVVEVTRKCFFPGLCSQRFPNFRCITSAAQQDTTHTHLESIPWPADVKSVMYWDKNVVFRGGCMCVWTWLTCKWSWCLVGYHPWSSHCHPEWPDIQQSPCIQNYMTGLLLHSAQKNRDLRRKNESSSESEYKKDLCCLICLHTGICLGDRNFQCRRKHRHNI